MFWFDNIQKLSVHFIYPGKPKRWNAVILGLFLLSGFSLFAKAPFLTAYELSSPPPKIIRTCCSYGIDLGVAGFPSIRRTDITSIADIGPHQYLGSTEEGNGIVYTKRGGFIDLGHLRDYADWTAYLYNLILASQLNGDSITIDFGNEGGAKSLSLHIPPGFDNLDAYELAGGIAYDLSLWHEIATWFGASYVPMIPERYSSFSPEDLYSNLLGVHLGIAALKSDLEYDDAMTQLLSNMLDSLESVSTFGETYAAMEKVENIWWSGEKSLPSKKILLKRYFDTDSMLTPWLVPGMSSDLPPYKLNKPDAGFSGLYELRIKLNYRFPIDDILSAQLDRTITQKDFGIFMAYVKQDVDDLELKMAFRAQLRKDRKDRRLHTAPYADPLTNRFKNDGRRN